MNFKETKTKLKESKIGKFYNRPLVHHFINEWELDLAVVLFIFMTIFQTLQVITRYLFKYSFVWCEELSLILFIWMGWLTISAAITHRKHMGVDVIVDMLPFKVKKIVKIVDNFIFIVFCAYFIEPSIGIVNKFMHSSARTALLKIPKWVPYFIIPAMLILSIVRLLQDSYRLSQEDEKVLGKSKSNMDFNQYEKEYQDSLAAKAAASANGGK